MSLHAKLQGLRSIGSREEDFFKVFNICGRGGHVGHVTNTPFEQFFVPRSLEATYVIWLQKAR